MSFAGTGEAKGATEYCRRSAGFQPAYDVLDS